MLNWTKEKLVNVADIKMSNVDKKTIETEMPIQLCNYTDVYKNSYIDKNKSDNFMFASCSKNEYDKFVLKSGQVAITKDSEKSNDIGIPTYISDSLDNVVLSYHLALFTPFEDKLDGKFLRYWLDTKQSKIYFENNASGSGQRYFLALDTVKGIPLFLPELKEQQEISNLLFNLDSKIELNNKINKELEAMAKMLYDYWFVQFDFPNENGKPYKSSGGKMVYNQELKREIPDGWEVKKLKELLINCTDGISNLKLNTEDKYTPIDYLPMKRMSFGDYLPSSEANSSLIQYKAKDILIGAMRVYFHRVCIAPFDGITRTTSLVLRPMSEKHLPYLYQVCNEEKTISVATKLSSGTQQPYVNWEKSLENYKIAYPNNILLIDKYSNKINNIINQVILNEQQNQELAKLRDWLLPMLMNGQVSVK